MIKYLGSKRTLVPAILDAVRAAAPGARTVLDLFSGTSRVGHALKASGYRVIATDHNAYAHALATCYVQADREDVLADAEKLVGELNMLQGRPGYFTQTFCQNARYIQPHNGERIDSIREAIASGGYSSELESVLLVSLMEAADRVDSTTGLQMAYLKDWSRRSFNALELRMPVVLPQAPHGKGHAACMDALDAAQQFEADVAYIDPPYNQHSYLGNYHMWETLVRWDKPPVYGVACKRVDVRERQSVFNSRRQSRASLQMVLERVRAPVLVVSFSNEGFITRGEMEEMLRGLWGGACELSTQEIDFKRYVGAQIGIYSPAGQKVGKVSHLRNKEYLYVAKRT